MSSNDWSPNSWRQHPVTQAVTYPEIPAITADSTVDPAAWRKKKGLEEVIKKLESMPPLVSAVEVSGIGETVVEGTDSMQAD